MIKKKIPTLKFCFIIYSAKKNFDNWIHAKFISKYEVFCKVWVATVFCVARTRLARPDLGSHAHVGALQFFGGRT